MAVPGVGHKKFPSCGIETPGVIAKKDVPVIQVRDILPLQNSQFKSRVTVSAHFAPDFQIST